LHAEASVASEIGAGRLHPGAPVRGGMIVSPAGARSPAGPFCGRACRGEGVPGLSFTFAVRHPGPRGRSKRLRGNPLARASPGGPGQHFQSSRTLRRPLRRLRPSTRRGFRPNNLLAGMVASTRGRSFS
jgi:hypothetical protein